MSQQNETLIAIEVRQKSPLGRTIVNCSVVIDPELTRHQRRPRAIYEQLEEALGVHLEAAPDEWDRKCGGDFIIEVKGKCIGLRFEPLSTKKSPSQCKWQEQFEATHKRFAKEIGGKVFIVYSVARGKTKEIQNPEVIDEIRQELERLQKQQP